MTMGSFMSQMGIGSKDISERLAHTDYGGGAIHDPHMIYAYDHPSSHGQHVASSKHHHVSSGHKNNSAMSALTLLAFLFFLHILQQCLREHMTAMNTPQVIVMTGGREGEDPLPKSTLNKIDKHGSNEAKQSRENDREDKSKQSTNQEEYTDFLTKIHTEEHTPNGDSYRYKNTFAKNYVNRSLSFPGFVSAMDMNYET